MLKHGSLISINLTISNEHKFQYVINPMPILYYWNGDDNPIDSIVSNKSIVNMIKPHITSEHEYSNSWLNCISFDLDSEDENYVEKTLKIQDCLDLSLFRDIANETIDNIAREIYKEVFNATYTMQSNEESIIYDVYSKVSLMYKDNITFETFVNFARKKLQQTTKLNEKNIKYIIENIILDIKRKKYDEIK